MDVRGHRMLPVPLIFTSGLAGGVNCYAAVLLLGLLGRFGHVASVPPALERPLEDLGVAGIVSFALFHPVPAAVIAAAVLVIGTTLSVLLATRIRRAWHRRRETRSGQSARDRLAGSPRASAAAIAIRT